MREKQRENKAIVDAIKLKTGCVKCGYRKNTAALTFDHIDPTTKYRDKNGRTVGIAKMLIAGSKGSRYSLDTILEEIKKCRVLCANCHAEITHPHFDVNE